MHGNAIAPRNLIPCPVPNTSSKFAHIELIMDAEEAKRNVCVRAAVGLHRAAGPGESQVANSEDPARLLFAEKGLQESCLTIDDIFHLDAGQKKVLELARPQLALVPLGYSVSLLLWDPHGPGTWLPLQDIVWQVIDSVFQELEAAGGDAQGLQTVSLVQVCAQGGAWDLLRPGSQALQVMDVAPLGLMVEEVTEIAVPDARAAMSVYAWGLGALPAPFLGCTQHPVADGCSAVQGTGSLFTLTLERELEGCGRRRSALRILAVPGGPGLGPEPLSPLLGALATGHPPASAGSLPWIVERLLEGNSLTFLLLCVALPDTSGEEILAALALAERVKGLAKTVSPTHWDPAQEAAVRRAEIRGLRAELLARAGRLEQERAVARLRRALRELQVLKSQRWEKKQMATKAFRENQMHRPGAKDLVPAGNPALGEQPGTQVPPEGASLEQGGGASAAESCRRGNSQAPGNAGQGLPEEPLPGEAPWPPSGASVARSQWQPCLSQPCLSLEVQFSLAKAQRQRLQAQHHLLLQQELGELGDGAAPGQEWDTARWQREVAVLGRSLEAARRERDVAEQDLEALLHSHRQEMEAWRQHTLQVFQAQRHLAEERAEALDRRYRVLLQEVLRDAVELSAQNQQLRAARQQGSANAATQTS